MLLMHSKSRTNVFSYYHGVNLGHTISDLIASNENFLIRRVLAGCPSCSNDDRVLLRIDPLNKKRNNFNPFECLLTDSDVMSKDYIVPYHKKLAFTS